ncbi:flagellar filament capping protein FliD [Bacillus sp. FJAT-29790]|uniref:flagellar filament capping protein FliD n=1 Tax=Bacillus sp. FJAT-29790 TaxID=1895002 RepID=UPI001C2386F9|nr:flagellar filament capping protein FliD [Bacillus sp. FJAT-29790]MBU8881203.1 flagellar filament capping protein FliD [Bacillus sp. FJAT-29790]
MDSIRFSGLASGMDTQSIVESMMKARRMPLDRILQKKQVLEWQRDDFRNMNKLLKEFDQFIFDGIFKQSKMLTRSAASSNSDFVAATASAEAGNVSYKIENVTLATVARVQSSGKISTDQTKKIDPTKSIWSQRDKMVGATWKQEEVSNSFTVPKNGASEFQLNKGAISALKGLNTDGKLEVLESDGTSVAKAYTVSLGKIPSAQSRNADTVYIDEDTGKVVFGESLAEGNKFNVKFDHNYMEFNIKTYNEDGTANTKAGNFKMSGTTSLNSMFNEINKSNVGINIFYDSGSDSVVAQRKDTGDLSVGGKSIEFLNASGNTSDFFSSTLKLSNVESGTNAKFTINGLETERKSNTFTMNDVTFTLKKSSTTESASINVKTDTEEIYKNIKDFIDKYNELIGKINGKLTEDRYPSFTPLSDEQKAGMKEKDIEKWEEKAMSGLLRRDTLLSSGLSKLRMDLYSPVKSNANTLINPKYNQLAQIGITTSKDYLENGKLEIDESKLKAAIEDNPEAVYQLFMADTADPKKHDQKGLARRLRSTIDETMRKIEEKAGNTFKTEHNYSMGKDLLRMKSDIDRFEDRLKMIEKRYWDQFNSMEKAMQRMNDQSSQLFAQLGAMMPK